MKEVFSNKEIAVKVIEEGMLQGKIDIINQYVDIDYIQHNFSEKDGRVEFIKFVKKINRLPIKPKIINLKIIGEGDLIASVRIFNFVIFQLISIDFGRCENELVKEHWDCLQLKPNKFNLLIPDNNPNTSTIQTEKYKEIVRSYIVDICINNIKNKISDYLIDNIEINNIYANINIRNYLSKKNCKVIKHTKLYKIIAENDFVITQSEGLYKNSRIAIYELFQLSDNKIINMWSSVQKIPNKMKHNNGAF